MHIQVYQYTNILIQTQKLKKKKDARRDEDEDAIITVSTGARRRRVPPRARARRRRRDHAARPGGAPSRVARRDPDPPLHGPRRVRSCDGRAQLYYCVESQGDAKDPLFIVMNGGPGASSLAGVFGENGPLLLTEEGSLIENPYAWNLRANVLAIEFAPGVGYSYCANSTRTDGGPDFCPANGDRRKQGACSPCLASDTSVAQQTATVLETLLGDDALFPELAGRPLYLLGESYAGVYLPTLAQELLRRHNDTALVNLFGVWATDPCTDNDAQFGWLDLGVDFAYQKGLISREVWTTLGGGSEGDASSCVASRTRGERRDTSTSACRRAWHTYGWLQRASATPCARLTSRACQCTWTRSTRTASAGAPISPGLSAAMPARRAAGASQAPTSRTCWDRTMATTSTRSSTPRATTTRRTTW